MFVGVSTALTAVRRVFHPFIREGLKLYYRFSDNAPDFLLDGSTSFDGSNDYISIADADNLSFGDGTTDSAFSVSAWIKMNDASDFKIINKGIFNSTGEWWLEVDGADKLGLYLLDESVASTYELALYNTALTPYEGQWLHICATYDGRGGSSANAGIKLYLNGGSVTTTLSGGGTYVAMENLGADVHIGKYDSHYADGSMANVGIWNRDLSASEIESIYWRGSYSELKDTELTNLVSWYDLNSIDVSPTELISNGTMETASSLGGYENFPNNWTSSAGSPSIHERSSTQAFAGTYSLRYGNSGDTFNAVNQDSTVTGGVAYRLEFYIYGVTGSTMKFSHIDGSANPSTLENGDALLRYAQSVTIGEWKKFTYDLTTYGSGVISGYGLQIGSDVAGTEFYIDNVSLKRINGAPDSQGSNDGTIEGATTNINSYSGESPFKPRIQDIATPKMAVQLANGSTLFDGSNDYISIADADNLSFGDGSSDSAFSLSAWIKMDDATKFKIFAKGIYNTNAEYVMEVNADDKLRLILYDEDVADTVEIAMYDTAITSYEGRWTHVCATYNGVGGTSANAGIKLYLNGSNVATALSDAGTYVSMVNGSADLHIGRDGSDYANGSIANATIHSSELTQTQIQELMFTEKYSGLSSDLKTNLVSWYDLGSTELGTSLITLPL